MMPFCRKLLLVTLMAVFCGSYQSRAQLSDSFEDGDFTQNPAWTGTDVFFKVNNSKQLQLNGSGEGTAFLSTSSTLLKPAEWRFWVKLSFSPSSNNFSRVYLISDQSDLSGSLNGYYLQLGEAGSNDALELFRQNGNQSVSICRGIDGLIATSFTLRIKVVHKMDGTWEIWADPTGGANFQLQASGNDSQINTGQYFGIFCKYTTSNATKMYFDDFYAGEIQVDITPPELLSLTVPSDTSLELQFSEALAPTPAGLPTNYRVQPGNQQPFQVQLSTAIPGLVSLAFHSPFQPDIDYILSVDSVKDLAGNRSGPFMRSFSIYQPQPYDIVINELMVDPDPPVGLPNWEYVELYNTTRKSFSLKGWKLVTGNTIKSIPDCEIAAEGFLILCRPEAIPELSSYGTCVGISSLSLTNTGQDIKLLDNTNQVISRVIYTDKWYRDPAKSNGGWSLEQIDPSAVCLGAANWKASENISGGTPGGPNSVLSSLTLLPLPEALIVIDNQTLKLIFNQNMDSLSLVNYQLYEVSPAIGLADSAWLSGDDFSAVMLHFPITFENGVSYRLILLPGLQNCKGEAVPENTFLDFTLAPPVQPFDVLITEIMADPEPVVGLPNFEYIEIYNTTASTIDLSGWTLLIGTSSKVFQNAYLGANSYLIIGSEGAASDFAPYGNFYGFSSFQLTNTGQSIALVNPMGEVIAWVDYTDKWYGSSPKKNGGWSLEMRDYENFCTLDGNWAPSVDASGGTPGRDNSVKTNNPDLTSPSLLRAFPVDNTHLSVYFSEPMAEETITNPARWSLPEGPGEVVRISPTDYRNIVFVFELSASMDLGRSYLLQAKGEITDCAGNSLTGGEIVFGLPSPVSSGDLIINEILTNPRTGGADYLEVMNNSSNLLDLASVSLIYKSLTDTSRTKIIFLPSWMLVPGQYYCLTRNPGAVAAQYEVPYPANLVEISDLPDFASDPGGRIVLSLRENESSEIDRLEYTPSMHLPVLKDLDGVALERINPHRPSTDPTNWTSAAESAGFGTPTGKNSQFAETPLPSGRLTVSPSIFSPDGDGVDDNTVIVLNAPGDGWLVNVSVYDAMGRLVRKLARALSAGIETVLSWDGCRDDRSLAPVGRYLIVSEFYNTAGKREVVKSSVVLAVKF